MSTRASLPVLALFLCGCVHAPHSDHAGMAGPRMPGACEAPASANEGKPGCWFDTAIVLGVVQGEVYYHVDEFDSARAAEAARTRGSAVARAYGRVFLETVNGDAAWRPDGGVRVATVGPMPAPQGVPVTARFMQAMTHPGAQTRPHRHDGAEAFVVLTGAICMETPDGAETTAAGDTYWVRGDTPMQLTSVEGLRRSLFVVLHRSDRPWMTMTPEWMPSGLCGPA